MKGIIFGRVTWTDGGSPVDRLTIENVNGSIHETKISGRSSIGFGISNPEYKEIHAFTVTEAGRVLGTDADLTKAYRILASSFPSTLRPGLEHGAWTLVKKIPGGSHTRYAVHVLSVEYGEIVDRSALVARLIGRKTYDGGVIMHGGGGMAPGTAVVKQMSDTLWGEGDWVEEFKIR